MSEMSRQDQLPGIRTQLEYWQDNLALRVAGEAQALALEIDKLHDREFNEVWEMLRTAHDQVLASTDLLRDLRRRLRDRDPPT